MDRKAAAVKTACLLGPLAAAVLGLHVFGEGLGRAALRLSAGSRYDTHDHGAFRIVVRRGSDYHEFAARTLGLFTDAMVRRHGGGLGLRAPDPSTSRVTVYLLESREDLQERGFTTAHADLKNNGGYFQPARLEIALLVSYADKDTTADRKALQHEMMHALMHLAAPRAAWSAWLSEGMAEYFENSRAELDPPVLGGYAKAHVDELREILQGPDRIALPDLLRLETADFRSARNRAAYRASHLLVAFLMESPAVRDRFPAYCGEERKDGPVLPQAFASIVGEPPEIEAAWRAWLK